MHVQMLNRKFFSCNDLNYYFIVLIHLLLRINKVIILLKYIHYFVEIHLKKNKFDALLKYL